MFPISAYTGAEVMGRVFSCWATLAVITESLPWGERLRVSSRLLICSLPPPPPTSGRGRSLSTYWWESKSHSIQKPFTPGTGGWALSSLISASAWENSVGRVGQVPGPTKVFGMYTLATLVRWIAPPVLAVPRIWKA